MIATFTAFDAHTEVSGQFIADNLTQLKTAALYPVLEAEGLNHIDTQRWYPIQVWLNVLRNLAQDAPTSTDFVATGIRIGEQLTLSPAVKSIETALRALEAFYTQNHRGGDAGYIEVLPSTRRVVTLHIYTPYPANLWYGVIYGRARRFLPSRSPLQVAMETLEDVHRYIVSW